MSFQVLFVSLWLSIFSGFIHEGSTSFDKEQFYTILNSNDIANVNKELTLIKASTIEGKDAYEGALLMKKAGLLGTPKDKLSTFKSGNALLESAIKKQPNNTEYRFLRLIIQENAPGILGYKSNLEEDKKMIVEQYKSLPAVVQTQIKKYSSTSKYLKPELFQ